MKTWLDITDTAVKIGLGAMISFIGTVWLTRTNNRFSRQEEAKRTRQRILEEVLVLVDEFSKTVAVYLAERMNAAHKLEKGRRLSKHEEQELKDFDMRLFHDFTLVNTSKSKLYFIGAESSRDKLLKYRELVDEFYKIAEISNDNCSEQKLIELKEKIVEARETFYASLGQDFKKDKI